MTTNNKHQLYTLLGEYINECKLELKMVERERTKEEFAVKLMLEQDIKAMERVQDVLTFDF